MMISNPSPTFNLVNQALIDANPFSQPPYVNLKQIWGESFIDLEDLNRHASDAVFKALEEIKDGRYSTTSLLITAQDGTGKTHLISRIRHHLQARGSTFFVYCNKVSSLSQIKAGFQSSLSESLAHTGSTEVRQWQELATMIFNVARSFSNPRVSPVTPQRLIEKFRASEILKIRQWIDAALKNYAAARPNLVKDPDVLKAILWTLSSDVNGQALYAMNWLAGKEIAGYKAEELRLPSQNQSFDVVLQVLDLISDCSELVLCFDELDSPEYDESGLHKSQVIAGLVKDLFENLNRGVILSVMMPGTWAERVKLLPPGVWNKVSAQGNPYDLEYMSEDHIISLVRLFLDGFYQEKNLEPPHPLYPFKENELRGMAIEKLTAREVLKWCRENCKPADDEVTEVEDLVESAFLQERDNLSPDCLDDNYLVADAIYFSLRRLINVRIANVLIQDVTKNVKKRGGRDQHLNFKVIGEENGAPVVIGVAVLQHDGGRTLAAGFKRLLDHQDQFGLTRGCLVRSKTKKMTKFMKAKYLEKFIEKGGEFVNLRHEEISPLIALMNVGHKGEIDYKLSDDQINQFIEQKGKTYALGYFSALIEEIMSDPSYQVPDLEEELETSEVQADTLPGDDQESNLDELLD